MKTSIEELISDTFVGKTLISSEFTNPGEGVQNIFGNVINPEDFSPFNKKIISANIGTCYRDSGILLKFEEWTDPFFFYDNDTLTIE